MKVTNALYYLYTAISSTSSFSLSGHFGVAAFFEKNCAVLPLIESGCNYTDARLTFVPDCILDAICIRCVASKNHYKHLPIVIWRVLASFIM